MKIVFIISGLSIGGAETVLCRMVERLLQENILNVISLTTLGEIGLRIQKLGIKVEALGMRQKFPGPIKFLRLCWQLKKFKPDIVQTWMYHADFLGGLAARLTGIDALVWSIHHSNLSKDLNKRSTLLVMNACALLSCFLPKKILSCSETARRIHILHGYSAAKMVVIPNGFDLLKFKPDEAARLEIRQELKLASDTMLVGLIGRYNPQKNHLGFIESARLIRSRIDRVHFVLAGNEIDKNNQILCQAITDSGLNMEMHLLGVRNDIPKIMAALDVLVSSSSGEAFPNVVGEAMACGIPCVVTDVGDSGDIVGDSGEVVPEGDMIALAGKIIQILQMSPNARKALGLKARKRMFDNYEIGSVVKKFIDFYGSLIKEKPRCAE